ncbi:pilus assembly FimT family protein [Clostridioides difficile]|uniref:hypothetical protein n=1 Tax=Clostridioides difficile TaxID=1496 RepID=UPI001F45B2B9|nr:hypothetical protein [Clostridioides difficile]MDV9670858.1 hypothetical protein [Clostridioides difficile]
MYNFEKRRNVTVIELIVSISIMLLIVTLSFPKDNLENHKINLFARQLCSDIRYVRRINMFSNYNTYIYYINQGKHEGYVLRKDGKNIKSIMLPKNAKIARSIEIIKFKSDGSPQKASTIEIYNNRLRKTITITPVSGRVLLKEGKYET